MTLIALVLVNALTSPVTAARPAPMPAPEARAERVARAHTVAVAGVPAPWGALAECESDGRWDYDGPSGFDGGLQFHPGTWTAYAPPGAPAYAWQADPALQVEVAERVLAAQGWRAWPACSKALGLR